MTMTGPSRTLYVTDLDGTLLAAGDRVPPASAEILAGLLADGLDLAVATARSPLTAQRALGGLRLTRPVVAYGGATAIDPDGTVRWWERFDARALHPLIGAAIAAGVTPLVFWLQDGVERIGWVRGAETAGVDAFVEARPGDARLAPVDGWDEIDHDQAFFVSLLGEHLVLRRLARMVRAISWGTGCALALQRHADDPTMATLDVTSARATKGTAVRRIADEDGFARVVALGDGANDLPLFAEADEAWAVATADEDVKAAATGVLPPGPDAVARFLSERAAQRV